MPIEQRPQLQRDNVPSTIGDAALAIEELVVEQRDKSSHMHKLKQSILTIGRDNDNDIVLPDGSVSRHHARLEWVQGVWRIVELGSTNGTLLGDRRLEPQRPVDWPRGTAVQMGSFTLRLRIAEEVAPTAERTQFLLPEQLPTPARIARNNGYAARRPQFPFSVSMWPTRAVDNSRVHIAIQNEANTAQEFQITTEAADQLDLSHRTWQLEVAPGVETRILFTLRVRQRPLYGMPRHYPYQIVVESRDGGRRTADGTAEARPLLSNTGLLIAGLLFTSLIVTLLLIQLLA